MIVYDELNTSHMERLKQGHFTAVKKKIHMYNGRSNLLDVEHKCYVVVTMKIFLSFRRLDSLTLIKTSAFDKAPNYFYSLIPIRNLNHCSTNLL